MIKLLCSKANLVANSSLSSPSYTTILDDCPSYIFTSTNNKGTLNFIVNNIHKQNLPILFHILFFLNLILFRGLLLIIHAQRLVALRKLLVLIIIFIFIRFRSSRIFFFLISIYFFLKKKKKNNVKILFIFLFRYKLKKKK